MPSRTKKFRGLRTHGRGKKSGRGAGIIGGHGKAGLGKTKRIQMIKLNKASKHDYYGRHGFKQYLPIFQWLVDRAARLKEARTPAAPDTDGCCE